MNSLNALFLPIILFPVLGFGQYNEDLPSCCRPEMNALRKVCGYSAIPEKKIVGGRNAQFGAWPWMADVITKYCNGKETKCGGTLINDRFILTAAHCLIDDLFTTTEVAVKLGQLDRNSEDEANTYTAQQWITHKDYDINSRATSSYDVALIELERDVEFSQYILPICIPQSFDLINSNYVDMDAVVIENKLSNKQQQVIVKVVSYSKCKNEYIYLNNNEICVKKDKESDCQGGSGGPMMVRNYNDQWNIIGIVSGGIDCGNDGNKIVLNRVASYLDWIKNNARMM